MLFSQMGFNIQFIYTDEIVFMMCSLFVDMCTFKLASLTLCVQANPAVKEVQLACAKVNFILFSIIVLLRTFTEQL